MRTVKIEHITPLTAERWLKNNNKRNRPISDDRVLSYSTDMDNGDWHETNASIGFDTDKDLVDGQHTLSAISLSGKSQDLIIVRGLHLKAMDSIDIGKSRTSSDVLGIHGETETTRLAAMLGFLKGHYEEKGNPAHTRIRPNQIMTVLTEFPNAPDKMKEVSRSPFGVQRFMDGYYYVFSEINEKESREFFQKVVKGIGVEENDPAYVLINRLRRNRESNTHKLAPIILAAYIVKAWNSTRCGKKLRSLHFREGEKFPTAL